MGQQSTEEATTGSRHTKYRRQQSESLPSYAPLYSAEDMTRDTHEVDAIATNRHFAINEIIIHEKRRDGLFTTAAIHAAFICHQLRRTTEEKRAGSPTDYRHRDLARTMRSLPPTI